jgi:deoxyribonuclease-4
MLPNGRRLGAHLPLGDGMVRAADRAAEIGATALQVFSDNPTSWRRRPSLPGELPAFRERLAAHGIAPLAIHAPYLVNLAGPDPAFRERSVDVMEHDLRVAAAYGAAMLNVHIGSHRGEGPERGARLLAAGLRAVRERLGGEAGVEAEERPGGEASVEAAGVTIVLENSAGGGFGLGVTIEELAMIDRAMAAEGVTGDGIGFCLDTAHLWGAGYPVDTAVGVDEVLAAFDAALGLARLRMVHLNDSRAERGSRSDRHEHIGSGRIGVEGFRRLLEHPGLDHVAYILETPGMDDGYDAVNLARVRDIAAGRPLPDLPPEAFHTRGPRSRSAPADDG